MSRPRIPTRTRLPTLSVYNDDTFSRDKVLTMVAATFPNIPNFTCDSWCYESEVDFIGARALDGGKVELRHRYRDQPHVIIVTTVTPEPGAVEFLARLELETGAAVSLPTNPQPLNLCWQLRRAPAFASKPDPYPEFIKRCFVYSEQGVVFLDQTTRRPIPVRPADDPYNNPPWVQMYVGLWQDVPKTNPQGWADYSPDRYMATVIGAVSRDHKYLAALGQRFSSLHVPGLARLHAQQSAMGSRRITAGKASVATETLCHGKRSRRSDDTGRQGLFQRQAVQAVCQA